VSEALEHPTNPCPDCPCASLKNCQTCFNQELFKGETRRRLIQLQAEYVQKLIHEVEELKNELSQLRDTGTENPQPGETTEDASDL